MKKFSFLFPAFLCLMVCSAQKKIPAFGEIDLADLQMKTCAFEPDAPAMKLLDVQESEYEPTPFTKKIVTVRRVRIKIFNEKGIKYATVKIPYYNNKNDTKVSELKGKTYSLDEKGGVVTHQIEEDDFFKEKATERTGMLSFAFPNVKPGSIIEYSYTFTEKNIKSFDVWFLSAEIPTAYTSNSLIIPIFSDFKETIFGGDSISRNVEYFRKGYEKTRTTFSKENIPSFKPEPFMTSARDNMLRMAFMLFHEKNSLINNSSTLSIWQFAARQILSSDYINELFRKIIPGTEKIVDTATAIPKTDDRIKYLYNVLKKRIPESAGQSWFPGNISEAWKKRQAGTAELNMILLNLLKRSGVICHPVLVSTRDHGMVNLNFPNFGQFNGLDIFIQDKKVIYLIDASQRFQRYNVTPQNILNRNVLIVDPGFIRWALITDDEPLLKQSVSIFGDIDENGKIEGTANIQYFDYAKSYRLDSLETDSHLGKETMLDETPQSVKIISKQLDISYNEEDPAFETVNFEYETQNTNEFYFLNLHLFSQKAKNPFLAETRKTDIDLGCNQLFISTMEINLNGHFEIEHLPKSMLLVAPDSSFYYKATYSANAQKISLSQIFEIKKSLFSKDEYPEIQGFFKKMYTLIAEEIVLKKKK